MSALSRLDLHHASLLLTALTLALSLTAGCAVPPAGANDFPCRTKSTLVVDTSGRLPRAVLAELPGDLFSPDTPFFKESLEVRPLSAPWRAACRSTHCQSVRVCSAFHSQPLFNITPCSCS